MSLVVPAQFDANGNAIPFYTESMQLDGVTFILDIQWNQVMGAWYVGISDAESNQLVCGRRIVVGTAPFGKFADPRLPAGLIMPIDTSNQDLDPGLNDLGDRVQLIYITAAELLAA